MANVFEPTIDTSTQARATGYSKDRHVFYTSDHRIIITYQDGDGVKARMSADGGQTWTNLAGSAGETQITSDTGYEWSGFIDLNDTIHITFADSSDDIKYVALARSANTWSVGTIYTVNTGTGEFPSVVAIESTIYVVWVEVGTYRDVQVKSSVDNGQNWSSAITISTVNNTNTKYPIIVSKNNQPMVIYSDATTYKIYASLYSGSSWPSPSEVYDGSNNLDANSISAVTDKSDIVHLVWVEYKGASWINRINYRCYTTSWQAQETAISQCGAFCSSPNNTNAVQVLYYPNVSVSGSGEVYVTAIYYEELANRYEVVVQWRGTASGSWDMNEGYFVSSQDFKNIYLNTAAYGVRFIPLITTRGTASPYNIEYYRIATGGVKQIDWIPKLQGVYAFTFNGQSGEASRSGTVFKAKNSKTIDRIHINLAEVTGSPGTATLELRSVTDNDARRPTSTILSSGTFTPVDGWVIVDITNYAITAGTYYAIVVKPGTVDASNYFRQCDTEPQHLLAPRLWAVPVGATDPGDFTVSTDTASIFLLQFTDSTYEGFPYHQGQGDDMYGNSWWVCQKWVQSGDAYIDGFSLWVLGKAGSPADNLDFALTEDGATVESGEICNTSVVETEPSWYSVLFDEPRKLKNGSTYRMIIRSPNSVDASNCWKLSYPNNTGDAPYDVQSWGGIAELLAYTTTQGSSWTELDSMDIPLRFFYTTPPTLEQEGYRFRADDGSETTASWLANQDTNITRAKNVNTRLRVLINATGDPPSKQFQLEVRKKGAGDWIKIT